MFVKPARSGSSFGVTKVECGEELDAALAEARRYDDKVVIEQAVLGTEVGCAVLGSGDDLVVGAVDQITLRHGFFRIHQEDAPEQGSENAVITVPAALPDATRDEIRETARAIYAALGCEGLAARRHVPRRATAGSCSTRSTPCLASPPTAAIPA